MKHHTYPCNVGFVRLIPRSAGFLLEYHIFVSCLHIYLSIYIYIYLHMYFIPILLIHMYICKYSIFCMIYHIYVQLLRSTAAQWQVEFPSLWSFQPPSCRSKTMTMTTLPKSVEGPQKNTVGNDGGNTNFSQKFPGGLEPKQGICPKKCPDCSSLGIIVYPPKFNMDEDDDIKVRSLLFLRGLCPGVMLVFGGVIVEFFGLDTFFLTVGRWIFVSSHLWKTAYIEINMPLFQDTCLNQSSISGNVPWFCFHISSWIASSWGLV